MSLQLERISVWSLCFKRRPPRDWNRPPKLSATNAFQSTLTAGSNQTWRGAWPDLWCFVTTCGTRAEPNGRRKLQSRLLITMQVPWCSNSLSPALRAGSCRPLCSSGEIKLSARRSYYHKFFFQLENNTIWYATGRDVQWFPSGVIGTINFLLDKLERNLIHPLCPEQINVHWTVNGD